MANDVGEVDERQHAAEKDHSDEDPLFRVDGTQDQIQLAEEPAERRDADHRERRDGEDGGGPRHASRQVAELTDLSETGAVDDRARHKKQASLHERVVDEVQQAACQPHGVREADAEHDIANLRHGRVGEHPLEVRLRGRHH